MTKIGFLVQMRVTTRDCHHRVRLSAEMDQRSSTNPNSTTTSVTALMALMSLVTLLLSSVSTTLSSSSLVFVCIDEL